MAVQTIDAFKAAELIEAGAVVVDVREAEDYATGHIAGAIHASFADFSESEAARVAPDKETPIIVCCYVGGRSAVIAAALDRMGYAHVYDLGSTYEWPFGLTV